MQDGFTDQGASSKQGDIPSSKGEKSDSSVVVVCKRVMRAWAAEVATVQDLNWRGEDEWPQSRGGRSRRHLVDGELSSTGIGIERC